jgi:hypothetical protein
MAVLTTLDTFTISGVVTNQLGSPTTTPGFLDNITVQYQWTPNSGSSGTSAIEVFIDFFLSDGTWMESPITIGPAFVIPDASVYNQNLVALFGVSYKILVQGVRPRLNCTSSSVLGVLKFQLRMVD